VECQTIVGSYRRRRAAQPEQQIQRAVFEHLAIRAASTVFAFHPANGGWRTRVEAAILKGMGVKAGVPDIIAIKGGQCYALELKAPDGRLTPVQRDAHAALVAAGATVAVAYDLDDALARLEAWGLLRGSCQGRWP
jgi:hypothetical protein